MISIAANPGGRLPAVAREDVHRLAGIGDGRSLTPECQPGHGLLCRPCRRASPHEQAYHWTTWFWLGPASGAPARLERVL